MLPTQACRARTFCREGRSHHSLPASSSILEHAIALSRNHISLVVVTDHNKLHTQNLMLKPQHKTKLPGITVIYMAMVMDSN